MNSQGNATTQLSSVKIQTVPSPPTTVTGQSVDPTIFRITWNSGVANGASIKNYTIYVYDASGYLFNISAPESERTKDITGLQGPHTYFIQISATNDVGEGTKSTNQTMDLLGPVNFTLGVDGFNLSGCYNATRTASSAFFQLCSTTGGEVMEVIGDGFENFGNISAYYENDEVGLSYPCNTIIHNQTYLSCSLQPGVGSNFSYIVVSGESIVPFQNITISYPQPTIQAGTLHRGNETFKNPLTAASNTGERVSFNGTHFGTDPTKVQVYYGPSGNLKLYTCTVIELDDSGVSCATGYGEGRNLVFSIVVGGVQATGTDVYQYPVSPQIYAVNGCDNDPNNINNTINCHTGGGQTITLYGDALTVPLGIFVGGEACASVITTNGSSATCILPPGTGLSRPVVAYQGAFISKSAYLVSYAPPAITEIQGCNSSVPAQNIFDCPRSGSVAITIFGSEFGVSGAKAFIGGIECITIVHNRTDQLVCTLPANQGKDLAVTIYQFQGELNSTSAVTVSYEPCPPGTHYENVTCVECGVGLYNDLSDRPVCLPCPSGRYTDQMNTTNCTMIPPGYKSIPMNTTWYTGCDVGTFSGEGAAECAECFPGFYQNDSTKSNCDACEPGRFTEKYRQSNCTACEGGKYALRSKASECLGCLSGQYSLEGSSSCLDCWAGSYSNENASDCTICLNGTYSSSSRSQFCTTTSAGYYALANRSSQTQCSEGSWSGPEIGRAVQQECRDRSRMPSSA
eukprot:TRINITY_DN2915_c0_g1_i6.p1 TRINITY_DN2915_c0_g1~~TRINITY_DN2915_c0_g1_i6.p1  ORF type:complete len:742 (-),score=50.86 TRINITY_DN2915_c0_g1_i6:26-2251(-)